MENNDLSFLSGNSVKIQEITPGNYQITLKQNAIHEKSIIFADRPSRESRTLTIKEYRKYLENTSNDIKSRNIILKYLDNDSQKYTNLAFTLKSASQSQNTNELIFLVNENELQKDFNNFNELDTSNFSIEGSNAQIFTGPKNVNDEGLKKEWLSLIEGSELELRRNKDLSYNIVIKDTASETLLFDTGENADIRDIETWMISEEWSQLFSESEPNALLNYYDEITNESKQIVFKMEEPMYNSCLGTLEFTGRPSKDQAKINKITSNNQVDFLTGLPDNINQTIDARSPSLFIDDITKQAVGNPQKKVGNAWDIPSALKVHNHSKQELKVLASVKGDVGSMDDPNIEDNLDIGQSTQWLISEPDSILPWESKDFEIAAYVFRNTGGPWEIIEPFWLSIYDGWTGHYQWVSTELGDDKMWGPPHNHFSHNTSKSYKGTKTLNDDRIIDGEPVSVPVVYNYEVVFDGQNQTIIDGQPVIFTQIYISGGEGFPPV